MQTLKMLTPEEPKPGPTNPVMPGRERPAKKEPERQPENEPLEKPVRDPRTPVEPPEIIVD